jgi:nucleoside-diphosphate-sugar epimerase
MTSLRIFVIGGHGRVALQFTKYASQAGHTIISQMRDASQSSDLPQSGPGKVIPLVKSLEDLSSEQVSELFKEHDPSIVLFAAGAGGKGGAERTFKVDRDGAIKVFDAIEKSGIAKNEKFRRLLLVSAVDVRDVDNTKPEWYDDDE